MAPQVASATPDLPIPGVARSACLTQRRQELVTRGKHRAASACGSVRSDLLLAGLPLVGPVPPLVLVPWRARTKQSAVTSHFDIQLVALTGRSYSYFLKTPEPSLLRQTAGVTPFWSASHRRDDGDPIDDALLRPEGLSVGLGRFELPTFGPPVAQRPFRPVPTSTKMSI